MGAEEQREISSPELVRIERGVGEESGSGNYGEESPHAPAQVPDGPDSEEGPARRGSHPAQEGPARQVRNCSCPFGHEVVLTQDNPY